MSIRQICLAITLVLAGVVLANLNLFAVDPANAANATQPAAKPTVLFSITSSGKDNPHAVTMALQLAGHAIDDGREVVLFFNVAGVDVPSKAFPVDHAFHDKPIRALLEQVMKKGASVQVCPHCMKAMALEPGDLIDGAKVTNREMLFGRLGPDAIVFTY